MGGRSSREEFMSGKLGEFPLGVVPVAEGLTGSPGDFAGSIADDDPAIQRDRDPFSAVSVEVALPVSLVEVVVPSGDALDQFLELRRIVRYLRLDETAVLAAD